jgi:UDP-N-acetylmuramoyl-tripeptide--D-alanyl-D-alanine ligase
MSFWTLDRVAEALGGGPGGAAALTSVSTDTRTIEAGALFVALRGERFDGHRFVREAVAAGAAGLVVDDDSVAGTLPVPVYVVPDTLLALADLARARRRAWDGQVVAIAGSNGKTTTKDITRAALGGRYAVHATTGNLNNRIGVPLTLLALPDEAEVAVVEAGTNVPGEIAILRDICEPNIAVITSIGEEHLEGLGDLEGVLREEIEIARGIDLLVAPAAHPEVAEAGRPLARRVVVAGLDEGDLRADSWSVASDGRGTVEVRGVTVEPPVRGAHNLRNTMLALAVALELGVSLEEAAKGIAEMPLPNMRVAWETHGELTLINDAYNANPPSARAALDLLAAVNTGRQRVAVLGSMLELGAETPRLHDEIGRYALASGAQVIAGVGLMAEALGRVAPDDARVITADDVQDLWPRLSERLERNAVVLLKGSRGARLERLVPHIAAWAAE